MGYLPGGSLLHSMQLHYDRTHPGIATWQNAPICQNVFLGMRFSWALVSGVTILSEVTPRSPSLAPTAYYSYTITKAALFVLVGFLSPLTFWRFDSLGLGLLFSAMAAGAVEGLQAVSEGHRASYLEFAAKLVLLFIGFAFALGARYDCLLKLGPLRLSLLDSHRAERFHS